DSWRLISRDQHYHTRPHYYTRLVVAPDNDDEVYFLATRLARTLDGGETATILDDAGGDHHDMWIDPAIPDRILLANDGGVHISLNRAGSWYHPDLPVAQMYHVAVDDRVPYFVYGNRQDGPTAMGPSNTLAGSEIPVGAWREVGGCEVGFTLPDPEDPNLVWAGCYDGILDIYDHRTGHSRNVSVWPQAVESWAAEDLEYRIQWTAPLAISPHDHETVYYGSQYVHRTRNQGRSWEVISPDLTTADPQLMRRTGGLTLDDAGPTIAPVVFAIAESALEPGVIWAGTNDGQVQVTRDGGESWTNVTAALRDVPPLGTISNVEPSRHAPGTAYITIDRHQEGDTATYVYRTTDYGASWKSLRGDLPQSVFSYAHCVREDPVRPGLLYLGTENELWVSFDDGDHWQALGAGLPPAPVHWIEVQEHFSDLVVATYGRGFWILDDLTPLRAYQEAVAGGEPALFAPRPTYRFLDREPAWSEYQNAAVGQNPEDGATLHYYLPAEVEDSVTLVIRDAAGERVRELEDLAQSAGLHRESWDLYQEKTPEVKLRTEPEESSHVPLPREGWRGMTDGGRFSIYAPPGTYTVELEVDGEVIDSRELRVVKDPASAGTLGDIAAQMEVLSDLHALITESVEMINASEWSRRQLEDLRTAWKELRSAETEPSEADEAAGADEAEAPESEDVEGESSLLAAIDELYEKLEDLEGIYFDLRLTGARQDSLRWKRLLNAQLTRLAWMIARTDVRPTDSQLEFYREVKAQVEQARATWSVLRHEDIPALNARAAAEGVAAVIMAAPVDDSR
ncbi:MAG: hypothetical protein O7A98_07520, partial [Acidobacteria bacterium]|nr:hypothetical protein [Acidobacteriota bacterium]